MCERVKLLTVEGMKVLFQGLKVTPTTFLFVRVVPAVVVIVALPAARHTAVVLTSKLVWFTRPLSCNSYTKCCS